MHLEAAQKTQRAKAEYIRFASKFRGVLNLQAGKLMESDQFLQDVAESDRAADRQLKNLNQKEVSSSKSYRCLEKVAHIFTVVGMTLLVVLAILNF